MVYSDALKQGLGYMLMQNGKVVCIKTTKVVWTELSHTWPKISSSGIYIKNMEALPVWSHLSNIYSSQELKVYLNSKGVKLETKMLGGTTERL